MQPTPTPNYTSRSKRTILFGCGLILLSLVMWIIIKQLRQPQHYLIPSGYMEPNFATNSILWVEEDFYSTASQVQRGDVILFTRVDESSGEPTDFATRVIGLPGDKIEVAGTTLKINGSVVPHEVVRRALPITIYREGSGNASYQVQYGDPAEPGADYAGVMPADNFFCLGDNRDNSYDSRYTGAVPFASIVGKRVP